MKDCLFCRIVSGEIPAKKVYQDEHTFAFEDINPQAPTHVLVVPTVSRRLAEKSTPLRLSASLRQGKLSNVFFFWSTVAAQELWQVLGERRARQHRVAAHLVGLLLQVALHV